MTFEDWWVNRTDEPEALSSYKGLRKYAFDAYVAGKEEEREECAKITRSSVHTRGEAELMNELETAIRNRGKL